MILMPEAIAAATTRLFKTRGKTFYRNGIQLEKGAVINENRIRYNLDLYEYYFDLFSQYPDIFIELITPTDSKFKLKFFQVIFLRACLRYGRVSATMPRAAGKSFICILALYLICIFRPRSHVKKGALIL